MKKLIFCLLMFLSLAMFGQNDILWNNKRYKSTELWEFKLNAENLFFDDLKLQVAKKDKNNGFVLISIHSVNGADYIHGTLTIYLEDESIIICKDRKIHDYVDNICTSLYYLGSNDVIKMSKSDISEVRFTSQFDSYTGENIHHVGYQFGESYQTASEIAESYHTASEVTELFAISK